MRSQEESLFPRLRRHAAGWVLLGLLWGLGQALALGHRMGAEHAGHHEHHAHAVGGEHDEGSAQCRLIDQAGLAEAVLSAGAPTPVPPGRWEALPAAATLTWGAAPWRPYEARAPPRA
jgi:hypothetical protein